MKNFGTEYLEDELWKKEQECEKWIQKEDGSLDVAYLWQLYRYGNRRAMLELGKFYLKEAERYDEAVRMLAEAKEAGCEEAIELLNQIPEEKRCGPKTEEGRELFERAGNGDSEAMLLLGDEYSYYGHGKNFPYSRSLSIYWYRQAAGAGIPRALYNMAYDSYRLACDYEDSKANWEWFLKRWREKAALAGHPRALFWLGASYCDIGPNIDFWAGRQDKVDELKAIELFRRALEQGFKDALCPIWHFEREAFKPEYWEILRQQAEQGDAEAQYFLATRYYLTGTWPYYRFYNVSKALEWLVKAREQGHKKAAETIDFLLSFDRSNYFDTKKDWEAIEAFRKANSQGDNEHQDMV